MTEEVASRLLEAIAANRLIVLSGAGLSMAAPSSLPSAANVAQRCAEAYLTCTGTALDPALQTDLGAMSLHFRNHNRFENFFIARLVPWPSLNGVPNAGHEAVADLLACGILVGAPTTNFDYMVETAAASLGEPDFRAVVDAGDLAQDTPHRPFIKLHGCAVRNRTSTIWCAEQLADPIVVPRMNEFQAWLGANVGGRDLVLVGFWSDWAYLTDLLTQFLGVVTPQHVYVVDPASEDYLEAKAPGLWAWAHGRGITFHHCPESGSDFLDELRRRWSRLFVTRLMTEATPTYTDLFGAPGGAVPDPGADNSADLYALRRDLSGTPRNAPVRVRQPENVDHVVGALHRRLMERGAMYAQHQYEFSGRRIRVVSGKGRLLSRVRADFDREPPLPLPADEVVCAGALADPTPSHLVRGAATPTIVRPGTTVNWVTHQRLAEELQGPNV
jgi:hypothetical protein